MRVTFARSPRRGEFEYFDVPAVNARFGFGPEHVVDYKALVGDTSDNIPGVPGVGAKTATKLIQEYGSLENILAHLDDIPERTRKLLRENQGIAKQSKHLATIVTNVPVHLDLEAAHALDYDRDRTMRLFHDLEFYSLVDKLPQRTDGEHANETAVTAGPISGGEMAGSPVAAGAISAARAATSGPLAATEAATAQMSLFAQDVLETLAEEGSGIAAVGPILPRPTVSPTTSTNTMVIDTPEALDVLVASLANAPLFALDTETDSTNELHAKLVGISLSLGAGEAYYIPVATLPTPRATRLAGRSRWTSSWSDCALCSPIPLSARSFTTPNTT